MNESELVFNSSDASSIPYNLDEGANFIRIKQLYIQPAIFPYQGFKLSLISGNKKISIPLTINHYHSPDDTIRAIQIYLDKLYTGLQIFRKKGRVYIGSSNDLAIEDTVCNRLLELRPAKSSKCIWFPSCKLLPDYHIARIYLNGEYFTKLYCYDNQYSVTFDDVMVVAGDSIQAILYDKTDNIRVTVPYQLTISLGHKPSKLIYTITCSLDDLYLSDGSSEDNRIYKYYDSKLSLYKYIKITHSRVHYTGMQKVDTCIDMAFKAISKPYIKILVTPKEELVSAELDICLSDKK